MEQTVQIKCFPDKELTAEAVRQLEARDRARYRALLDAALETISFTASEAFMLAHQVLAWPSVTPADAGSLWRHVQDAIRFHGQAEAWDIPWEDAEAVVATLRAMSPLQAMALVDACERFWLLPEDTEGESALQAVGLLPPRPTASAG